MRRRRSRHEAQVVTGLRLLGLDQLDMQSNREDVLARLAGVMLGVLAGAGALID